VSRDISQLMRNEERLNLVALELKHRMKNTIAMIQAIANQTLRGGPEVDGIKAAFTSRLATLGEAQDLLTQAGWARTQLHDVIERSLQPHCSKERFAITGPAVELSSKTVLAMALAMHELATNAVKYGALSNDDGRIEIFWEMDETGFHFRWQEIDGPPVVEPSRSGFGSRMIEKALAGYFQGVTKIIYHPAGVVFTLDAPIEAMTAGTSLLARSCT